MHLTQQLHFAIAWAGTGVTVTVHPTELLMSPRHSDLANATEVTPTLHLVNLQMQGCAKKSVSLLDRAAAGQHTFDILFLTNQSPVTTYDYLFHVTIPQPKVAQLHSQDVPTWIQAEKKLEGLIKQVSSVDACFW